MFKNTSQRSILSRLLISLKFPIYYVKLHGHGMFTNSIVQSRRHATDTCNSEYCALIMFCVVSVHTNVII